MGGRRHGFTIVELLIVVVVVSILATITTAAFSGVQSRARNNSEVAVVTNYIKALKLYEADNGAMPDAGASIDVYRCIGENYPSGGCGTRSGPVGCGLGGISNAASVTFNASIRGYMNGISEVPRMNVNGQQCSAGGPVVGAIYVYRGSTVLKRSEIYYILPIKDGGTCVTPGGSSLASQSTGADALLCRLYIN